MALAQHAATAALLFPEIGATSVPIAGGVAAFMGAKSPISYAVGLGFNGAVSPNDIQQVVEFYQSRSMVPRVDVCPLADASLLTALREHGFQVHWFVNVLTRRLEIWDIIAPLPEGITVRQAKPEEDELWTRVVDEGFSDGKPLTEHGRQLGLMMFHRPGMLCYLAEIGGDIAGGGVLFTQDGYAALMAASVRPQYRKRGVHTALIRARLRVAQELNCDIAGLFAEPGNAASQRNAERHGFHVAYTKAAMKKG